MTGTAGAAARAAQGGGLLFVLDPLDSLKAYKDSSIAMMRELARRGHAIWACTPRALCWESGTAMALAQRITLPAREAAGADGAAAPWYATPGAAVQRALAGFDAVLMRKDPPFDAEYLYATHLLDAGVRAGARVFNAPAALRNHNEKLAIAEFDRYIAPTLVTGDPARILAFHAEHGRIVVKPLDGMGGSGIFHVAPGDPNVNVILETLTQLGTRTVMAQRYLPQIAQGDKRILLIAGRPVPYALARVPKPGESRGNLAAGGTGHARPLSERDREIAEALGPELDRRGLLLVGLDVIGDWLTEINVTSPTCFVEIYEQSGFDVAAAFADALEARVGVRT
jgi:glutathione synthase